MSIMKAGAKMLPIAVQGLGVVADIHSLAKRGGDPVQTGSPVGFAGPAVLGGLPIVSGELVPGGGNPATQAPI